MVGGFGRGPPGVSGKTLGDLPDALVRRNIELDFRSAKMKVKDFWCDAQYY
jgi:hypothetical protein